VVVMVDEERAENENFQVPSAGKLHQPKRAGAVCPCHKLSHLPDH